jgi:ElaB/YqjD/DUF883 family membrane-anchored ribosome-binding protein
MVSQTTKERLSVIENEVKNVKEKMSDMDKRMRTDMQEIKDLLHEHTKWEAEKYETLESKFADKWVEKAAISLAIGFVLAILGLLLGKL